MKKLFIAVFFYVFLFDNSFAWIFISELYPNTIDDTNMEYIELTNSWNLEEYLSWFLLQDKSWKNYIFWSSSILTWNESIKFYRTRTKIILNNSDEEVYLYDNLWNLVDSFIYNETVKWEILTSSTIPIFIKKESNNWNLVWEEDLVPEIIYDFQIPTYFLEEENNLWVYNCDTWKKECKLNLDLRDSFSWDFSESNFNCILDFDFGTENLTLEENKCNPNTIIIPIWTYNFNFKIENKNDSSNFSRWSFRVINDWYLEPTQVQTIIIEEDNNIGRINIVKPEIIVQSWLDENNICKNEICKINLNYEKQNSKEECIWDFWPWIFTTHNTDKKCNPWYIEYSQWKFEIKLKVYQEDINSNYVESVFEFKNEIQKEDKVIYTINEIVDNKEKDKKKNDKKQEEKRINLLELNKIWINKIVSNLLWLDNFEDEPEKNQKMSILSHTETQKDMILQNNKKYSDEINIKKRSDKINIKKESDKINIQKESNEISINQKKELLPIINIQWKIWKNKKIVWNNLYCYNSCSVKFWLK